MRIAVVGARGQLGAAVVQACAPGHEVRPLGRAELDVTDDAAVARTIASLSPDAVVNCAAYNDVDGAEDHPIDALDGNAFAVRALARAAAAAGATFVHYGTDFVFDGTASRPYTEEDQPNPRSVYAASKLLGEWFALDSGGPRSYVLRVESLFGAAPGGRVHGSVLGIERALAAGETAKVFSDRTISPSYVIDIAAATQRLIETAPPAGIYHCVNSGQCTWLDLAHELARLMGREPRFQPVKMSDVTMRASRPLFCALSNAKLASVGIVMPAWQDALARYVRAGA